MKITLKTVHFSSTSGNALSLPYHKWVVHNITRNICCDIPWTTVMLDLKALKFEQKCTVWIMNSSY